MDAQESPPEAMRAALMSELFGDDPNEVEEAKAEPSPEEALAPQEEEPVFELDELDDDDASFIEIPSLSFVLEPSSLPERKAVGLGAVETVMLAAALGRGEEDEAGSGALTPVSERSYGATEQLDRDLGLEAPVSSMPAMGAGAGAGAGHQAAHEGLQAAHEDHGLAEDDDKWFTVDDLRQSWLVLIVQVYHAWAFALALVVFAGMACNTFLNMFVKMSTQSGSLSADLGNINFHDWSVLVTIAAEAMFLALVCAGVMQRGLWLLQDAVKPDMFRNYRRTLCLEGPGPGTFAQHRRGMIIREEAQRRQLHRVLSTQCTVEHTVQLGKYRLLAGSQLLAVEAMSGKTDRDDVLDMSLPAKLVFRVDARPTSFRGMSCCSSLRALMDLVFQILIFVSLDILPLVYMLWKLDGLQALLSMSWFNDIVTAAVYLALGHIAFYYIWSTFLDYVWKFMTALRMCRHVGLIIGSFTLLEPQPVRAQTRSHSTSASGSPPGDRGVAISQSSPRPDVLISLQTCPQSGAQIDSQPPPATFPLAPAALASNPASSPAAAPVSDATSAARAQRRNNTAKKRRLVATEAALLEEQAEMTLAVSVTRNSHRRGQATGDDFLNLCVGLRNVLSMKWCHCVVLTIAFCLFVACIVLMSGTDFNQNVVIGLGFGCFLMLFLFCRFRLGAAGRKAASKFVRMVQLQDKNAGLWALWFRVNCGFDPMSIFMRQVIMTAAFLGLAVAGVYTEQVVVLPIMMVLMIWSLVIMWICIFHREGVWKYMLMQNVLFALFALLMAWSKDHDGYCRGMAPSSGCGDPLGLLPSDFLYVLALCFLCQAGMSRFGKLSGHSVFVSFFVLVITIIGTLTLLTSVSQTGGDFGGMDLEWCNSESEQGCTNFTFPVNGTMNRSQYAFCSLTWPMGAMDEDENVTTNATPKANTMSDRCADTVLTVTDFMVFSRLTYFFGETPQEQRKMDIAVKEYMPGWQVAYSEHYNVSAHHRNSFLHFKRGSTSVVAVRGTTSAAEMLADVNFWLPAAFLQIAATLGPALFSMRSILQIITMNVTQYRQEQFKDVTNYTRSLLNSPGGDKVYITGHSLGGGLAVAIGALLQIPSVTFSAPGLLATSAILDPSPDLRDMRHFGVNVVPDKDLVPRVDSQSGVVMQIDCPLVNPLGCHSLATTMCEILASCGDGGGRDIGRGYVRSCKTCQHTGQSFDSPLPCVPDPNDEL